MPKYRIAINSKGQGKRGGSRIITHVDTTTTTIYLLTIYDKSEKADVKSNELSRILNELRLDD